MTDHNLINVCEKESIYVMWSGVNEILQGKELLYKEMKTITLRS